MLAYLNYFSVIICTFASCLEDKDTGGMDMKDIMNIVNPAQEGCQLWSRCVYKVNGKTETKPLVPSPESHYSVNGQITLSPL